MLVELKAIYTNPDKEEDIRSQRVREERKSQWTSVVLSDAANFNVIVVVTVITILCRTDMNISSENDSMNITLSYPWEAIQ